MLRVRVLGGWLAVLLLVLAPVPGAAAAPAAQAAVRPLVVRATLSGAEEVPPVATRSRGTAVFWLSPDGTTLRYMLALVNLIDPTAAHIHVGARGVNGPVVAFLCGGGGKPDCPANGAVSGTLTAADLRGPLMGQSLSALVAALASGDTYTNVHTPSNPGGEVRGQNDPIAGVP